MCMFCVRRSFLVPLIVYALVVQLIDLSFIVIILDARSRQDFPWGILFETVCVGLGFAGDSNSWSSITWNKWDLCTHSLLL